MKNNFSTYVWFSLAAIFGGENAVQNRDLAAKKLTPQAQKEAQIYVSELLKEIQQRIAQEQQ